MLFFKIEQFTKQLVPLGIRDFWLIQDVVAVIVVGDFLFQFFVFFDNLVFGSRHFKNLPNTAPKHKSQARCRNPTVVEDCVGKCFNWGLMINKETIHKIAKLAKLKINEAEAEEFSQQLSKALSFFEQISKVDTKGVEPLVTPSEIESFWREDVVKKDVSVDEILANAPARTGNLFTVPPVV